MSIWIALAMIALGILAIYLEFFIPAFGVIGIGGIVVIMSAVVLGFQNLPAQQAMLILFTALILAPLAIVILLRRLPRSFLGRRLILNTRLDFRDGETGASEDIRASGQSTLGLVGKTGVSTTPLHPAGFALIDEKRCSVVTNGEYLPQGTSIVVSGHFGSRIVVREADFKSSEGDSHDV